MFMQTSCNSGAEKVANTLCNESAAPFGAPEFNLYKTADFLPAFEQGIEQKKADIQKIIDNSEAPTYANTIDALELSGRLLDKVNSIFFTLNESDANDEMLQIENSITPKLTELSGYVFMNDALF